MPDEMPSAGSEVVLRSVTRTFPPNRVAALRDVSVRIEAGQAVALTGPSGSGKSTLLHVMGGIERVDAGEVEVAGADIAQLSRGALAAYRRTVGLVFQRFNLIPALTALDNVLLPLLPFKVGFDRRSRARELLARVGLEDRLDALPAQLSGGQQQRVAIARALIGAPALVLADEPTGSLDSATGTAVMDLLLELSAERGMTLVVATHDQAVAERCTGRVQLSDGALVLAA